MVAVHLIMGIGQYGCKATSSLLSRQILIYRATLIRTFKTEYQPPTGGTTEQEILKQVPCSFYARTPGERRTRLAMPAL